MWRSSRSFHLACLCALSVTATWLAGCSDSGGSNNGSTPEFAYLADAPDNQVIAVTIDPNTGALSAVTGSPFSTTAGPVAVAVDPAGRFAYVADRDSDQIAAFTIDATSGALTGIP